MDLLHQLATCVGLADDKEEDSGSSGELPEEIDASGSSSMRRRRGSVASVGDLDLSDAEDEFGEEGRVGEDETIAGDLQAALERAAAAAMAATEASALLGSGPPPDFGGLPPRQSLPCAFLFGVPLTDVRDGFGGADVADTAGEGEEHMELAVGLRRLGGVPVKSMHCGSQHVLLRTVTDELFAFGAGSACGVDEPSMNATAVTIAGLRGGRVADVAAGDAHSAAVVGGRLFVWGGIDAEAKEVSAGIADGGGATHVAACGRSCVAVTRTGEVYAWEQDGRGSFLGHSVQFVSTRARAAGGSERAAVVPDSEGVVAAAAAAAAGAAAATAGDAAAAADGGSEAAAVDDVIISAGGADGCGSGEEEKEEALARMAAAAGGSGVAAMGLGAPFDPFARRPRALPGFFFPLAGLRGNPARAVKQLVCGKRAVVVLTAGGDVWTWGAGAYGLGHGDLRALPTPRRIDADWEDGSVACVAAGSRHFAALTAGGQLWMWGDNCAAQLGSGLWAATHARHRLPSPERVQLRSPWSTTAVPCRAVCCGEQHSLALSVEGDVFWWGTLGGRRSALPAQLSQLSGLPVSAIAAGPQYGVALVNPFGMYLRVGGEAEEELSLPCKRATFGTQTQFTPDFTPLVVAQPSDASRQLSNADDVRGAIAIVNRGGGTSFIEKTRWCLKAGAVGVVFIDNNVAAPWTNARAVGEMPEARALKIVSISYASGQALLARLPSLARAAVRFTSLAADGEGDE